METILDYETQRVSDIALHHPTAVKVFNHYNIDYCCGGKRSLKEACAKVGVDTSLVVNALLKSEESGMPGTIRFDNWDAALLSDFIVQHHHAYVRNSIPLIQELLDKVCSVHGHNHPELYTIQQNFQELSAELFQHMDKEERILFPEVKRLFNEASKPLFNVNAPIAVMEDEHEHAGNLIKSIRSLTNHYTPPADACPTFRVTFKRMQEFEQDLMQHIHLENNVLFAKVKERAQSIF